MNFHIVILLGCYTGSFEKGERLIAPLRDIGAPIADFSALTSRVEAQIQYHIYNPTLRAINLSSYAQGIFPVRHLAPFGRITYKCIKRRIRLPFESFGKPNIVTFD